MRASLLGTVCTTIIRGYELNTRAKRVYYGSVLTALGNRRSKLFWKQR
jgi:hypothetical protein